VGYKKVDRAKCVWEIWEEVYKVDKRINVIVINVGNGRRWTI